MRIRFVECCVVWCCSNDMRVCGACKGRLDVFIIGKEFIRVVVELLKVDTISAM